MAYGLDVEAVYYTDHELTDMGVFDTYSISIDLANEKDFEIKTAEYRVPVGGFWYIPDTEYGGIVRAKSTDSDEEEATYEGSSWRGILAEHQLEVDNSADIRCVQGDIHDLANELIEECGLENLFVCDEPYTEEGIDIEVDVFQISRGMTLYDVLWNCARSINFTYVFTFNDGMVHLLPILSEDYTDYMVYSSIGALSFNMEENWTGVNHAIITSIDEDNIKRTIHLFNDGETILPYTTTETPLKDSDYILDKSQQVLTGPDEIAEYSEVSVSPIENYILVNKAPENWKRKFGNYFYREVDNEQEKFYPYEAVESISYSLLKSKPKDWNKHYSNYYDRQVEQGEYTYTPVSATSTLDKANKKKVKNVPRDWKTDYSQYYYEYQTGTGIDYATYSGVSKNKYVKLTKKPSDWSTNYTSYYRKVIEKERYVYVKDKNGNYVYEEDKKTGKKKKKKKKQVYYVDAKKDAKGKYVAVTGNHAPAFKSHTYYRRDSYTVPPKFLKNKTYMIPNKEVAPTWIANTYYRQKVEYKAPAFVNGNVYRLVYDHYKQMIDGALERMSEQMRNRTQKVTMDDFIVNIGDTVGGRDEFTGETIVAEIDNINATIDNGMVEVEYVIGG